MKRPLAQLISDGSSERPALLVHDTWAKGADFEARTEAGRLIGPFNPALLTPTISSAFIELAVAEQKHTSLDKRSRKPSF
jgi:hypothetical protein